MNHLVRRSRAVRLGGVRLWPLRRRVGGHWYTVAPMTLLRWLQYTQAVHAQAGELLSQPVEMLRALVPLMVTGRVSGKHLRRAIPAQIVAVASAFETVNDIPYLLDQMKPDPDTAESPVEWGMVDAIDFFCEVRPAYKHEQVKNLPAQEFFAFMEAIKKKYDFRNRDTSEDEGRELTPADLWRMGEEQEAKAGQSAEAQDG